ncbi:MAG: sigma 54-interacting transcriptional regulator [Bacillota bacterium]
MPLVLQSKLLRVLQNKQVERVGGISPVEVDVRVISASHKDLKELVRKGKFRDFISG